MTNFDFPVHLYSYIEIFKPFNLTFITNIPEIILNLLDMSYIDFEIP